MDPDLTASREADIAHLEWQGELRTRLSQLVVRSGDGTEGRLVHHSDPLMSRKGKVTCRAGEEGCRRRTGDMMVLRGKARPEERQEGTAVPGPFLAVDLCGGAYRAPGLPAAFAGVEQVEGDFPGWWTLPAPWDKGRVGVFARKVMRDGINKASGQQLSLPGASAYSSPGLCFNTSLGARRCPEPTAATNMAFLCDAFPPGLNPLLGVWEAQSGVCA